MPDDANQIRDERRTYHFWLNDDLIDRFAHDLGVYGIAVYVYLARRAKQQQAFPSIRRMAKDLKCGTEKIQETLKLLKGLGLIAVTPRLTPQGDADSNLYTLLDLAQVGGVSPSDTRVSPSDTPVYLPAIHGVSPSDTEGFSVKDSHLKEEDSAPRLPEESLPSKPKASRRCPLAYTPTPALRQWAATKFPQLDFEEALEAMRDYEFATGHTDWEATLRTWLRTEAKRSRTGPGSLTREERRRLADEQSTRALEEIVNGTYTGDSVWQTPRRDGPGLSRHAGRGHEGGVPPGAG